MNIYNYYTMIFAILATPTIIMVMMFIQCLSLSLSATYAVIDVAITSNDAIMVIILFALLDFCDCVNAS